MLAISLLFMEINGFANNIKIVQYGDEFVGKTSLKDRFFDGEFRKPPPPSFLQTAEYYSMNIKLEGHAQKYNGLEFHELSPKSSIHYRNIKLERAHAITLVYSVDSPESFAVVENFLQTYRKKNEKQIIAVLANKIEENPNEQDNEWYVSAETGRALALKYDHQFFPVSAENGTNVINAYTKIITKAAAYQTARMEPSLDSKKAFPQGCCFFFCYH